MSWFRIDDNFYSNAKVLEAGNAAVGLWLRGGAWTSSHLKEGFIPLAVARSLGSSREISALLHAQLWSEVDGGYLMPDYLDYNPSAAQVEESRRVKHEAKVRAGQIGGKASGVARAKQNRSTDEANGKQNEAPSRPVLKTLARTDRDAIWNALSDTFGEPATSTEKSNRGRQVRELLEVAATPDEIQRRIQEHSRRRLNWKLTANALIKHWTDLEPKATDARKFDSYTGAYLSPFMSA